MMIAQIDYLPRNARELTRPMCFPINYSYLISLHRCATLQFVAILSIVRDVNCTASYLQAVNSNDAVRQAMPTVSVSCCVESVLVSSFCIPCSVKSHA